MTLKTYTEEEWFDTFYPKQWGNWKEFYNAKLYGKNQGATGCTWMDYEFFGYTVTTNKDGQCKVNKWNTPRDDLIEHFFIECGSMNDEQNVAYFLCPYYQVKTKKYYANVVVTKMESNLDIYKVYVAGNDDASYTKHFLGFNSLKLGLEDLRQYGVDIIQEKDQQYLFTN